MQNLQKSEDPAAADGGKSCCGSSAWWRLPLLLALVLAAIVLVNGRGVRRERPGNDAKSSTPPANVDVNRTVALTIRLGESNSTSVNSIPWREGMTVRDLLSAAFESEPSKVVKFSQQGTGESAFLTQLAGVTNEGAGGRNWMYEVNGQHADRSFAVYVLRPGDSVLWKFDQLK